MGILNKWRIIMKLYEDIPTVIGWYWIKGESGGEEFLDIVCVRYYMGRLSVGNTELSLFNYNNKYLWAGPIPQPLE
jgi:hypothetical protein